MKKILWMMCGLIFLGSLCFPSRAFEQTVHPLVKSLIEADLVVQATYLGMESGKGLSAQGHALFEIETSLKGEAQGQLVVQPFDTIDYYNKGAHFILVLRREGSGWVAVQPESMRKACFEIFQPKVVDLYQQVLNSLAKSKNPQEVQGLLEVSVDQSAYMEQEEIKISVTNKGSYLLRTHAVSAPRVSIENLVEKKLFDGRYVVVNKTDSRMMRNIDLPGWLDINESLSLTVQVNDLKLQSGHTYRIGVSYQDFFIEKVAYTSDFVIK